MNAKALTPIQLHALALLAKDAAKVRDKLTVADHDVDFSVHVAGTVSVSGNQTIAVDRKPNAIDVAALLLGTYGPIKRKAIVQQLIDGNHKDAINDDLRALATELLVGLSSSSTQQRRGSVTGKITTNVE